MRRAAAALGALLLVLACALTNRAGRETRLAVEVLRGFQAAAQPAPRQAERVEILLDVTPSMTEPGAGGQEHQVAARAAAAQLLRALPADTGVGLHVLGIADSDACTPAFRMGRSGAGEARTALLERLEKLPSNGEGSLAGAVEALRVYLAASDTLQRTRVAILTDLDPACGGDLCEALSTLAAWGAQVDVVAFGERPTPECADEFAPVVAWHTAGGGARVRPPVFRAQSRVGPEGEPPRVLATGRADGTFHELEPGPVSVVLDLVPPLEIGPLQLEAGSDTTLQVLDFPALDPPVREWRWERVSGRSRRDRIRVDHGSGAEAVP